MVTISVKSNIEQTKRNLRKAKSQVPFAMSNTLNTMAFTIKKDMDGQILTKIDRPKPYTRKSINVDKSSKRTLTATVKVRDRFKESSKLRHLFIGGRRIGQGFEGKLVGIGVLPRGMYVVPGDSDVVKKDSFGNIRKSFINKLVNYFNTFKPRKGNVSGLPPGVWMRKFTRAQKKKRKKAGKTGTFEFFVVHKHVKRAGIKRNEDTRPPESILFFEPRPRYKRVFDMKKTAESVLIRDLQREFDKNYQRALSTAR